jgi:uncharacterized protein DUF3530
LYFNMMKLGLINSLPLAALVLATLTLQEAHAQATPDSEPTASEEAGSTSQTEPAPQPQTLDLPLPDLEKRNMELLAEQAEPDSVVWLQALDERFLALYEPEITGNPQGAVLLLHAEGQHASWPNTIEVMRTTLPEYGWATLATTLPVPDALPVPERELPTRPLTDAEPTPDNPQQDKNTDATGEARPETEEIYDDQGNGVSGGEAKSTPPVAAPDNNSVRNNDTIKTPAELRANQRIRAAMTYLNDKGQFNIVLVGDGMGAARGGDFVMAVPIAKPQTPEERPLKPIRAMVIINARNSVPSSNIDLPKSLFDPEVPTLDIYFGTDVRDPAEAERRRKYAKRQGFQVYQQIRLPEIADNKMLGENRLARRVRGFLNKHAKGSKVDNAIVIKR